MLFQTNRTLPKPRRTPSMYESVHNVPDYAKPLPFWIAQKTNDGLWFYGAWSDYSSAETVARRLKNCCIITNTP